MEQMTVLVLEAVLKIHHMVVEVFNGHGCLDGRVFNGQCVIMWWRVGWGMPSLPRKSGRLVILPGVMRSTGGWRS